MNILLDERIKKGKIIFACTSEHIAHLLYGIKSPIVIGPLLDGGVKGGEEESCMPVFRKRQLIFTKLLQLFL